MIATPDYSHPARYMDFMLRRDGSEYYLYAIQRSATQPEAASAPASLPAESASASAGSGAF
jgi:hypothetical protein